MTTTTKAAARALARIQIQSLIATNDRAVPRALVALYRRQTAMEQSAQATLVHNGRGFTGSDAPFLTSLAKWVLAGRTLSEKQMFRARKLLPKYWGQLMEVSAERAAVKAAQSQSQEVTQ